MAPCQRPSMPDMPSMSKMSSRESLFCALFVQLQDPAEAAIRAGYRAASAGRTARRLLDRADIQEEIRRRTQLLPPVRAAALAGLRRIAFGPVNDAVKLALGDEHLSPEDIAALDLFAVSELRRPKGGGLEIKFHDRIAALRLLLECGQSADSQEFSLFDALEQGAAALQKSPLPEERP